MKWQRTLWPPFYISIIGNFAARTVSWAKQGRGKEANLQRCQGHTLKWDRCPILLPFPFCFINIESCFTKTRYELSACVVFCVENISLCHIEFSELLRYCLMTYLLWKGQIRLMHNGFYKWCVVWAERAVNKTRVSLSLDRFDCLGSIVWIVSRCIALSIQPQTNPPDTWHHLGWQVNKFQMESWMLRDTLVFNTVPHFFNLRRMSARSWQTLKSHHQHNKGLIFSRQLHPCYCSSICVAKQQIRITLISEDDHHLKRDRFLALRMSKLVSIFLLYTISLIHCVF